MRSLRSAKLSQREAQAVRQTAQALKAKLPVSQVILFGSKARGQGDVYSDIDLLELTRCPVTHSLRGQISDELALVNLQHDLGISSIVVSQDDWKKGLVHHMLIYREVQRDGCAI